MEENKLERAVGQFVSAHQLEIGSTELAPTFLVVTLLLTHFALGYLQVMPGVSYADAMCLGGVTAIGITLPLSNLLRERGLLHHLAFALSAIACVTLLLSRVPNVPWHGAALFASSICAGAFVALASAFWFEHFIDRPMESIALSLTSCLVGGVALSWFLIGATMDRFTVGYGAMILFAGISLGLSLKKKSCHIGSQEIKVDSGIFPPLSVMVLLVSIFVLCFATMLSVSYAGRQSWHSDEIWLIILPAALVALFTVLFMRRVEAGVLLNIALAVVAASLLLSSFFAIAPTALFIVASNGITLTVSLTILFMADLSKRLVLPPCKMGIWAVLTVFLGFISGRVAEEIVCNVLPDPTFAQSCLSIACVVLLIVCVSASLHSKSLTGMMRHEFNDESMDEPTAEESQKERLTEFAESKGLGAREQEALALLLQGCSASEVADKMFIANGTAKAHIRHIYQKLEVSTRDDLFREVERHI